MKLRCLILEAALSVRPVRCGVTCHSCQQLDRVTISVCRLISSSAERGGMSVLTPSATPFPLQDRFCEQRGGGNRLWFSHHPSGGFIVLLTRRTNNARRRAPTFFPGSTSVHHVSRMALDGPFQSGFSGWAQPLLGSLQRVVLPTKKNRSTEPVQ